MVDGVGGSKVGIKTETKVASQIKAFGKKETPTTKGPAPLSPISPVTSIFGGFNIKRDSQSPVSSPLTTETRSDELNLNSIERSETLNHLTVSRVSSGFPIVLFLRACTAQTHVANKCPFLNVQAKAPKRRPPSAIITREEVTPRLLYELTNLFHSAFRL